MKVTDGGSYYLLDRDGLVLASREHEYVPGCIPGSYGDYIEFNIDADGVLTNWKPTRRRTCPHPGPTYPER